MAKEQLKNIFLSASIPLKERDAKYYDTADVIAIRDAVLALTTEVLPRYRLIWGGHPSITPLIAHVMERLGFNLQDHVLLYQSRFFKKSFPKDNEQFGKIILTENMGDKDFSLLQMRQKMFAENEFAAGVFIGGMKGVEDELKMFRDYHPRALILPVASTGAAALKVYEKLSNNLLKDNGRLKEDYAFSAVFQDLLIDKI